MQNTAIYPGSFDPVTNGHLDVIERATKLFSTVVVAVANNSEKTGLFTPEERVDLIRQATSHLSSVRVTHFQGLVADFADKQNASALIRGIRAISDFEYEFQMALMNRQLNPTIETLFLLPRQEYIYLSSRIVKEVASFKGDISKFVPHHVAEALITRLEKNS